MHGNEIEPCTNFILHRYSQIEPTPCCRAATAECYACTKKVTVEEYCTANPTVLGCPGKLYIN